MTIDFHIIREDNKWVRLNLQPADNEGKFREGHFKGNFYSIILNLLETLEIYPSHFTREQQEILTSNIGAITLKQSAR